MSSVNNLGFGCVSLTQHRVLKNALNILNAAFDQGIRHFDTAPLYGNGYSEKIVGTFIKNKREQLTITTKFGLGNLYQPSINLNIALLLNAIKKGLQKKKIINTIQQPALLKYRIIDADYIKCSLTNSLKNLQTDYIDYYLLHEAMPAFLTSDAILYLKQQQKNGFIRELGIAAGYVNFFNIDNKEIDGFTVLQYENGLHYKTDDILNKFSSKKHFYHSSLKSIPFLNKNYSGSEWAGILLSRACKINPSGKILFSTTKIRRLKKNIAAFNKYNGSTLHELNNIINAIY